MPAAVVGGEVEVIELVRKVTLAAPPIDAEVFGQERRYHHAQAVVHVASLVELTHRGIDQRIAGAALAPRGEQGIGIGTGVPADRIPLGLERACHHVRVVVQDVKVEIAPDQLREPDFCPAPAGSDLKMRGGTVPRLPRLTRERADRDRAEAQMYRQIRRPLGRRKIAPLVIRRHARLEVGEELLCTGFTAGDAERMQVGGLEADVAKRRYPQQPGRRAALHFLYSWHGGQRRSRRCRE